MKTILVTGGSGLVGYAIKKKFSNYHDKYNMIFISSKDCDLSSYEKTYILFKTYKPNYVTKI
jgi:dTDP-4-dehydrorhamnose reductase